MDHVIGFGPMNGTLNSRLRQPKMFGICSGLKKFGDVWKYLICRATHLFEGTTTASCVSVEAEDIEDTDPVLRIVLEK